MGEGEKQRGLSNGYTVSVLPDEKMNSGDEAQGQKHFPLCINTRPWVRKQPL